MTCARWYGPGDFRLEQREVRQPGPAEALVHVLANGVCGSDVHAVFGDLALWEPPLTLGHEGVGVVEEIGERVHNACTGDLVAVAPSTSCGSCFHCREGEELLCLRRVVHDGMLADYCTVPDAALFPLPKGIGWQAGIFAEPLSSALHAVTLANVRQGEWLAVIGGGPMGLLITQLGRLAGARVVVSETQRERRALALQLGADAAIDPVKGFLDQVRDLTGGLGADRVIEAVGTARAVQDAISAARRGGTVVIMGVADRDAEVPLRPYELYLRQLTLRGSFIRQFDFQRAVRLLPRLQLELLVTDEFPLAQTFEALKHVRERRGIKTVVRPERL